MAEFDRPRRGTVAPQGMAGQDERDVDCPTRFGQGGDVLARLDVAHMQNEAFGQICGANEPGRSRFPLPVPCPGSVPNG